VIQAPPHVNQGSTAVRAVALAALIVAVALLALALLGGGGGYRVKAVFQDAGQLVPGNEVRIGGAPVGTISEIELDRSARAVITLEVEDDVAPLREGTTATIRATSLVGVANRYVSLTPGPANRRELADGGVIGPDDTTAPVDLDQVFNSLDARTRAGLRDLIRGQADWYDGRSEDAAQSTKYLAPFLVSTTDLTRELALDQELLERFLADTSATVGAIAQRRDDLAGLVRNTSTTAAAIADENVALARALDLLPGTLRKANTTFVNLRATLDDLDVLVEESKPATRELAPLLRRLRPLVRDARPTVADLRTLIRRPGRGNDLIELVSKQPRLAELTAAVFPRAVRTLDRAQPVIEYARGYTPDLAAWFTKFGQVAGSYDANGHYARIMPVFSPTALSAANELEAIPPGQRLDAFDKGNVNRCPGGGVQPAPDGTSPYAFMGCDTSTTPPGP